MKEIAANRRQRMPNMSAIEVNLGLKSGLFVSRGGNLGGATDTCFYECTVQLLLALVGLSKALFWKEKYMHQKRKEVRLF